MFVYSDWKKSLGCAGTPVLGIYEKIQLRLAHKKSSMVCPPD
jgi:hypothetical protein